MRDESNFHHLRQRAKELLKTKNNNVKFDSNIYQLLEELHLHQIELEVQNDDLIQSQLELQTSHDKFANLYNLAPVAYFTLNSDGLIIDVNQTGLDLLGMKKNMLINRCISRYIAAEYQMVFSQYRQHALSGVSLQACFLKLIRWSGPVFDAKLDCKVIHDINGKNIQLLICITDISSHKALEQFLHLQQSKMASIDKMRSMNEQIYSIANSQNHALTVINNYIYGCIRRLESEKFSVLELLQTLKKIAQQSRILASAIHRMMSSTSKTVLRYEVADINTVIHEMISLINFELLEFPVAMHFEPVTNLPFVKLDKLNIQHVILNLARNSIEAMRDAKIHDPKLLIETSLTGQHIIIVNILDNGPGFEPQLAQQLFEPHFTTKDYAIGLGLSVSRTIVEKHGGRLTAQVNATGGAHFQLALPCTRIADNN